MTVDSELEPQDWAGVHQVIQDFSKRIINMMLIIFVLIGVCFLLSLGMVLGLKRINDQSAERRYERCLDDNASSKKQHDLWDPILKASLANSRSEDQHKQALEFQHNIDTAYPTTECKKP